MLYDVLGCMSVLIYKLEVWLAASTRVLVYDFDLI